MKTMLFNPYTGKPRDPRDIASDPSGILMIDPDEPLIAAALSSATPAVGGLTDEFLDDAMRVCMSIAGRYAFVGDAAFPRGREEFRAILAASPVPMSDTGAKEVPIAVLRRAFLASDGTLPDLIGHFCNEWNASIASTPPQSANSGLTAEFFAKHAQGSTTPQSAPGEALHPRTADLVDRFADSLKAKLAAAEKKYGYSDKWANDDWQQECAAKLLEHVAKGDPRDVAAYCAFMWHHDWSTTPTQASHGAKCPARDGYPCCCEVTQSVPQGQWEEKS